MSRSQLRAALLVLVLLALAHATLHFGLGAPRGLREEVFPATGFAREPLSVRTTQDVGLARVSVDPRLDRDFSVRWSGVWYVPRAATYDVWGGGDDRLVVIIDGDTVLTRDSETGFLTTVRPHFLEAGPHDVEIRFEQFRGSFFMILGWAEQGGERRSFSEALLFPPESPFDGPREARIDLWRSLVRYAWALFFVVVLWTLAVRQAETGWPVRDRIARALGRSRAQLAASSREDRTLRPAIILVVSIVVLYGALLRFDAAVGRYGLVPGVALSEETQLWARGAAAGLRPSTFNWELVDEPYVRGDPITYIRFARLMESFYAAHIREPLFVFTTKIFIGALGDRDVGVTYASAFYSTLLIWATYLLGAYAFARWVGLAAALAVACEYDLISWGVAGWRDDAFAFFLVVCAYALLRLRYRPTWGNAILAGVVAAGACLTRISALSFLAPGFVWALMPMRDPRLLAVFAPPLRQRAVLVGAALLIVAALVGPYLVNCWIVYGDPLFAVNDHTRFYRQREQLESDTPMSFVGYISMVADRGAAEFTDTVVNGLTTYPFNNKWGGLSHWSPQLAWALRGLALVGLALFAWSRNGRFLLFIGIASLLPYALTWKVGGGAEWRFTMHAYPLLLLAAFWAIHEIFRFMALMSRGADGWSPFEQRVFLRRAAATFALAGGLALVLAELPHRLIWQNLRNGGGAHLRAGPGDSRYFISGWYPAVANQNVTARYTRGARGWIKLPMLSGRDHQLTLRLAPYLHDEVPPQTVRVSLNGVDLATLELEWNPSRMGSYEVEVPRELVSAGANVLLLEGSEVSRASGASGDPFVRDGQTVAFMVWYVNVMPGDRSDEPSRE